MQLDQRLQSILILIRVRSHPTSEAIFTICLLLIHQPTHHPSYSIPFTIILPATATATATAELHSMDSLSFTQTNHPPPRLGEYLVPGIQDFIHSRSPSFLPIDHPTIVVLHPIPGMYAHPSIQRTTTIEIPRVSTRVITSPSPTSMND